MMQRQGQAAKTGPVCPHGNGYAKTLNKDFGRDKNGYGRRFRTPVVCRTLISDGFDGRRRRCYGCRNMRDLMRVLDTHLAVLSAGRRRLGAMTVRALAVREFRQNVKPARIRGARHRQEKRHRKEDGACLSRAVTENGVASFKHQR